jgi:methylenetetrahydrofolate reductase (NADPH)
MTILNFGSREAQIAPKPGLSAMIENYSIEVMPRTAAKVEDFRAILPQGTRVYIAHIDGTPIEDMLATAARLHAEGFPVMPHFPARSIPDAATLEDWIKRYRDAADIRQALLLGGGIATPRGDFDSSIQLIETGLFDKYGFTHLHVAGHPEGNKDIDKQGNANVDAALMFKQDFSTRTDAEMAIATQFAFDADAVIAWAERIRAMGVTLPIHAGIAGPAKLQTLIQFALTCGVGPSIGVLQKRARDITKLLVPYEPTEVVAGLVAHKAKNPQSLISQLHVFPLGGIKTAANWMNENGGETVQAAAG